MHTLSDRRYLSVLLIDDNPDDQELVREAITVQPHPVQVEIHPDGPRGLNALRAHAAARTLPDVLLLDIRMPVLTGFDVLAAIRRDPDLTNLPVVMLTTSGDPEDLRRASELNTTACVIKAQAFPAFVTQVGGVVRTWMQVKYPESRDWA